MFFRLVLLFLTLLLTTASAYELQAKYSYTDHTITSTTLFPDIDKNFVLLKIPEGKTKYKVPVSTITNAFSKHGISLQSAKLRYVAFSKKSPIELGKLESAVKNFYLKHYPSIKILDITITPRVYTKALPESYTVSFGLKSARQSKGTFYIRTKGNKKIFFDYKIAALLGVIHAKHDLKRKSELTPLNTITLELPLDAVRGEPLTAILPHQYRLKQNIKARTPITKRHVQPSPMVKRGKHLLVSMKSGAVLIEFAAIALEDGALHDIISIRKRDGQRLQAKVTGVNQVEVQ